MKKFFKVQLHVFSIFFLIILLSSCASAKVTLFGETYPPKGEDTVIDVYSTNKPLVNYKEIGLITCGNDISSESSNMKQILKKHERLVLMVLSSLARQEHRVSEYQLVVLHITQVSPMT